MIEQGKYQHLWMKYSAVLRVLLKKVETSEQRLQLFKHEVEVGNGRDKSAHVFTLELKNGRVSNNISSTAIARDLVYILDNNKEIRNLLKERSVKFSMDKAFELKLEKI